MLTGGDSFKFEVWFQRLSLKLLSVCEEIQSCVAFFAFAWGGQELLDVFVKFREVYRDHDIIDEWPKLIQIQKSIFVRDLCLVI